MKIYKCILVVIALLSVVATDAQNQQNRIPPGIVINHLSSEHNRFIGSPSIVVLPNGNYIASHDEFGPTSTEFNSAVTRVYCSQDKGLTWKRVSQISGQFWSNMFVHNGVLYIIGTNKHHGNLIIRKSNDEGLTWSVPYDSKHGLIIEGEYHTAPVPVLIHKGRIWRAVEYATHKNNRWGERYSAMVVSASVNSDLLNGANWTKTNHLSYDSTYLDGRFGAWLEGNVVADRKGHIVNILRVHVPKGDSEVAAIVNVSKNGKQLRFNKANFYPINGASKKFTIRYDSRTNKYWNIVNIVPDSLSCMEPNKIRNTIALTSSIDLRNWHMERIILSSPDHAKIGFQYVDWVFDGDDILLVSRTAWWDKAGGAKNSHDANYLTFHRIKDYRDR